MSSRKDADNAQGGAGTEVEIAGERILGLCDRGRDRHPEYNSSAAITTRLNAIPGFSAEATNSGMPVPGISRQSGTLAAHQKKLGR